MSKHTSGPWQRKKNISSIGIFDAVGHHITRVPYAEGDAGEANARLIAAAPDLLDALQEAFRAFAFDDEGPVWADSTIAKARAAIAKATGEAA